MRLTKYRLELIKENSCNYGDYTASNPLDVEKILNSIFKMNSQPEEIFVLVCLDIKNKIIGLHEVSRGTLNSSLVHPREVFKRALANNACKIIVAHNHPANSPTPSQEDRNVSDRLVKCGQLIGIDVVDHIIITEDDYFSFKENMMI